MFDQHNLAKLKGSRHQIWAANPTPYSFCLLPVKMSQELNTHTIIWSYVLVWIEYIYIHMVVIYRRGISFGIFFWLALASGFWLLALASGFGFRLLAFGFSLLAFGFWLLASSGIWLLAFGFWHLASSGFWLLAFGFFWLLASGFELLASAAFGLAAILHEFSSLFAWICCMISYISCFYFVHEFLYFRMDVMQFYMSLFFCINYLHVFQPGFCGFCGCFFFVFLQFFTCLSICLSIYPIYIT